MLLLLKVGVLLLESLPCLLSSFLDRCEMDLRSHLLGRLFTVSLEPDPENPSRPRAMNAPVELAMPLHRIIRFLLHGGLGEGP
eukprot:4977266-Amphidinium_carterae.1